MATARETGDDPAGEGAASTALDPARLAAANIHPDTRLASDYLNHFNEAVMLVDMLSEVPECAPDVVAWQPRGYADYFRRSRFTARELAIAAYATVEPGRRAALETTVAAMDRAMERIQRLILEAPMNALPLAAIADLVDMEVRPLLSHAAGLINGAPPVALVTERGDEPQSAVDALFE